MRQHLLENNLNLLGFDVSKKKSYDIFATFTDCMFKEPNDVIMKREFSNLNPSLTMFIQIFTPSGKVVDSLICRVEKNVNAAATPQQFRYSESVFNNIGNWLEKHPSQHLHQDTNHVGVGRGVKVSIPDSLGNGVHSGVFQNLVEDLWLHLESRPKI